MRTHYSLRSIVVLMTVLGCSLGCQKNSSPTTAPGSFDVTDVSVDGNSKGYAYYNFSNSSSVKISFSDAIDKSTIPSGVTFKDNAGVAVSFNTLVSNGDSSLIVVPTPPLVPLSHYNLKVLSGVLKGVKKGTLAASIQVNLITPIDSSDKFPQISDSALLDLVQKQSFKFFWDFGHPVSGLARDRNTSGDLVTSGGSGFGVMAIVTAISRQFITRSEGIVRMQKIVDFLKNKAQTFHGAFPHFLNGVDGKVIPFSTKDNGADLVETSLLMQGLLTARQFFNGADPGETALRSDINLLWNAVEWNWFQQNNQNVLYWHWSPNYMWDMNFPIHGWNEALITYVMSASSTTHNIPKTVYDIGWAGNPGFVNNNTYYGYQLPLGPDYGGPLFFAHYSFLGINPNSLLDAYADYWKQNRNHSFINYNYCKTNPRGYYGYSSECWGLTASDIQNGYTASSPTNDVGVIAPTAALSSFPYTPVESMKALKFFYYKLGDKIWNQYGFVDAFSLKDTWFASSTLAIDQGPIIIMIENYRSGLLWNLFMSCPEIKTGMHGLGFQSPFLN